MYAHNIYVCAHVRENSWILHGSPLPGGPSAQVQYTKISMKNEKTTVRK